MSGNVQFTSIGGVDVVELEIDDGTQGQAYWQGP